MWVRLLTLSCLISSSSSSEAGKLLTAPALEAYAACSENPGPACSELGALAVLPQDIRRVIFAEVGFASFYQMLHVTKSFYELANQAIRTFYSIQREGKAYLNYTALIRELNALVQDAAKDRTAAEASTALESSVGYLCIKAVLEAQFGYCIRYAPGQLPKFMFDDFHLDMVNDHRKVSVLPYLLDEMPCCMAWSSLTAGLAASEQFDMLGHMTFSRIRQCEFDSLVRAPLPTAIVLTAARALQRNSPNDASELLALVKPGEQPARLPEDCRVPLCILHHLLELKVVLPNDYTLVDGLEK